MKKSEDNDDIMRMLEQYEDYPDRRFYDHYRYANGRFAPKGRGTRRGYVEPPYYHQMPEDYHRFTNLKPAFSHCPFMNADASCEPCMAVGP